MRVAIPLFGTRVAPRCTGAESVMMAIVDGSRVRSKSIHHLENTTVSDYLDFLAELKIETIICGAASESFREEAKLMGLDIVADVAGEADDVLRLLSENSLRPGTRIDAVPKPNVNEQAGLETINCVTCVERVCLKGGNCVPSLHSRENIRDDGLVRRRLEVASDVALERDRKLCRIAELVYFCLGMDYGRLGVAFCVDMFHEAEILVSVLERFFEVVPVCCKVGGITPDESGIGGPAGEVICNALGQAEVLNAAETDCNIIAGLCVGCDTLFVSQSKAPATTLFVKDKMLANNPVSALFSKYYLDDLTREI